eukprot:CAMPEP_0202689780 /NCGR_PEP_ID=MMETSP1385-20130828/4970_1 /ASSEMBLY_ACC=CAM_ASM_000861 /TAXON_ID=933848 /ORGANISM="Elphidium margaritaceum" /LENGTH=366 /DNA_ID=CAMNT_0049344967 /DNA_START=50 /DNA_END=1150 /DNA_ORIENTATION=+
MGTGNSAESSQKVDKLVGFLQGIIADKVVTDAEFEALDDFKERESIDEETYALALQKIGCTVQDVEDMRPSKKTLTDNTSTGKAADKVEKFVEFLRGILADDIVTDKELTAIHKYRAAENIDTETYGKALAVLGKTFNDMARMKNNFDDQSEHKLNGLVQFLRGIIADDVVTDKEWTALEEYKEREQIEEKTYQQALAKLGLKDVDDLKEDVKCASKTGSIRKQKTMTKVKLTRDGSLDKRSRAYKVLKEAGVDTEGFAIVLENAKNRKRSRTELEDGAESKTTKDSDFDSVDDSSEPKCKKQRSRKLSDDDEKTNQALQLTEQRIEAMTANEMRKECQQLGVKTDGNELQLRKRLKQLVSRTTKH